MVAGAMLGALVLDAVIGWPDAVFDRIGHPVTWAGKLIDACDRRFNHGPPLQRRLAGIATAVGITTAAYLATALILWLMPGQTALYATILLAWPLIAARSLHDHVKAVALPLSQGNLPAARAAVAMIVGRDPDRLDEPGVARAALESLAENASDGVIAPLFWGVLLGLPGLAAYKAINTMDSMIGHLTPRHAAFGWAAARIDDIVNLIPARLTGLLFAAVSGQLKPALHCMWRDARLHRSPNAGWPEAAMAGALGVRLSGPRAYDGQMSSEPWVNDGARDPVAQDLALGLMLYLKAILAVAVALAVLALI